jgi:hypothetical protein
LLWRREAPTRRQDISSLPPVLMWIAHRGDWLTARARVMTQYQQRPNENVTGAAIRIADALNCWLSKGQKPPHLLRCGARVFRAELMNCRRLMRSPSRGHCGLRVLSHARRVVRYSPAMSEGQKTNPCRHLPGPRARSGSLPPVRRHSARFRKIQI